MQGGPTCRFPPGKRYVLPQGRVYREGEAEGFTYRYKFHRSIHPSIDQSIPACSSIDPSLLIQSIHPLMLARQHQSILVPSFPINPRWFLASSSIKAGLQAHQSIPAHPSINRSLPALACMVISSSILRSLVAHPSCPGVWAISSINP